MKIIGIMFLLATAVIILTFLLDRQLQTQIELMDQLNPFTITDDFEYMLLFILGLFLLIQFYLILRR